MNDKELEELLKTISIDVDNYIISENTMASSMSAWSNDTITINPNIDDVFSNGWFEDWERGEEWKKICRAAENNEALQKAIERVKILYYLSKEDGSET